MDSSRMNKRIFTWSYLRSSSRCKNWAYYVKDILRSVHFDVYCDVSNHIPVKKFTSDITNALMEKHTTDWHALITSNSGRRGTGRNKLRTYQLFKTEYKVEEYCKIVLPLKHRSAFSKFRCGVAPLRIETGRYENLNINERLCPFCDAVEDEKHVILKCNVYTDLRNILCDKASSVCQDFINFNDDEKLSFLFKHKDLIRICAKTCFNILQRRNSLLFS